MTGGFDGVILGTGHNALVLQAYLCRAGLRVLSVDRAESAGGGLATIENPRLPGFLHNTHSFFHRAITTMPWYTDLELEGHGARYIEPALNVAMICPDSRVLKWWTDLDRTLESVAAVSRRDADVLAGWIARFEPIVENLLIPESSSPPLTPEDRRERLESTADGRLLLEVSALSPLEFVRGEFEDPVVRAGLLFFNGLREVDLRLPGFGHSIPALLAGRHKAQMCVGGSSRLAEALVADVVEHGGEVRCGVEIDGILVERGRAIGVALANGERIDGADFVVSGLNPQQTLVELIDADWVPETIRRRAERFEYNLLAPLFALNLALTEPPAYTAATDDPDLDEAFMTILGLGHDGQFEDIVAAHQGGAVPATVMWGAVPTRFDPSQAPEGQHTAFMWEKLPYRLGGAIDGWDRAGDAHGEMMFNAWAAAAPNLSHAVLDRFVRTPRDTVRSLPNMREGDLLVGAFGNDQVGYHRPFPGAGHYRAGVDGLYLCGGSCHPGGNITGLCGYNAAGVVLADLGRSAWWNPAAV
ncbi:MAG: NAD(P)/FAD-dependent oxidoreductase [Planctomycetota bacterium]|nr:NAD(P)/FAD-dependent oxidoreductase [Planctomycetota bacterium]